MFMSLGRGVAALLLIFVANANAAVRYRWSFESDDPLQGNMTGAAIVDGDRWRIDYDADPTDAVRSLTVMTTAPDKIVGLNPAIRTWFHMNGYATTSMIFTLPYPSTKASAVRVTRRSLDEFRFEDGTAGTVARIAFSYRIVGEVMSEKVGGEVKGETTIWSRNVEAATHLPWPASELRTGFEEVDKALEEAFRALPVTAVKSETRVSRKLDGGPAVTRVIRRSIADFTTVAADPETFKVPAGYTYQEPLIGSPGASHR